MNELQKRTKVVLAVSPAHHRRVMKSAKKAKQSIKDMTTLLLDFALSQYEAGEIHVVAPKFIGKGGR